MSLMGTCCIHYDIIWRAFQTDDPAVTMFVGPSSKAEPLEIGVVTDGEGTAIIHARKAREKFLKVRGRSEQGKSRPS